jgi:hypothetical protein
MNCVAVMRRTGSVSLIRSQGERRASRLGGGHSASGAASGSGAGERGVHVRRPDVQAQLREERRDLPARVGLMILTMRDPEAARHRERVGVEGEAREIWRSTAERAAVEPQDFRRGMASGTASSSQRSLGARVPEVDRAGGPERSRGRRCVLVLPVPTELPGAGTLRDPRRASPSLC